METKLCKKCLEFKSLDTFSKHPTSKDGYLNQCKDCVNLYQKEYRKSTEFKEKKKTWGADYYQRTKPERRKTAKRWRHNNPELELLCKARNRAKTKDMEYNLTVEDIIIPELCPVLGIKLERNLNGNGPISTSPTIDRIDNSKGYIKGNVRVISFRANSLRNDATIEEIKLILKDMEENNE